jgi:outer membrane protein
MVKAARGTVINAGALLVWLLAGSAGYAQGQAASLTLDDAIARGLANSQRIAEFEARRAGASATEQGAGAQRLPIVAVTGGYQRTNHVDEFSIVQPFQPLQTIYPDVPDNYRARLDLQWPIYTGGRVDALERAARAEHEASGEDLTAARADLRLEITRAFWALVTARESERVLARALDAIGAHVRDLRSRLDQGLIPPNDLLSAEAQQSRQRLLSIEAANSRSTAEADLRRLLGADPSETLSPSASLGAAPLAPADPDQLVAQARTQRAERRALEDREAAARARIDAAAGAARPQIAVNGGYDYARPNPRIFPRVDDWHDSWDVSVNVTWSLWDGGRINADRAQAAASARAAASRVADFDRQMGFEVEQRRLEVDSSRAAIQTADDGVRAATEAYRVVVERFRVGVATNTEVLDAETALLQAELDRTRALANARLAEARLERAVGK